jgi:phosphomannomutase
MVIYSNQPKNYNFSATQFTEKLKVHIFAKNSYMTLIKSISGIRGTIGGKPDSGLTPVAIVKFTAAYAHFIQEHKNKKQIKITVGRDARVSGEMVNQLVIGTLTAMGADVVNLGLSTTPTVEIAVPDMKADGGIILTASHNPIQWNALKLLNEKGEFLSGAEGAKILEIADNENFEFAEINELGSVEDDDSYIEKHIQKVLSLDLVDVNAIRKANFKVAIDAVNSTGGLAIPALLEALGVQSVEKIYCNPTGIFPHNPEPLPEHLSEISKLVVEKNCDIGFVVDPDVDRLAIVREDGHMFGEEYTLVAVAEYILQHQKGNTVSNLSSTRALRDITENAGGKHFASAVGEVNVVEMMKTQNAIIGGEGNGGVIYPASHYGRDALAGIALFLSFMAKSGKKCSEIRKALPDYAISKNKIELSPNLNVDAILHTIASNYKAFPVNKIDGVKIDFPDGWVHLRKSNTEPIIRIYAEKKSLSEADALAKQIMDEINNIAGK